MLHTFGYDDEVKTFYKSLKNWAYLYLASSPGPGVFLGVFNQTEPISGKSEGVLGQTGYSSALLFLWMRSARRWLEGLREGLQGVHNVQLAGLLQSPWQRFWNLPVTCFHVFQPSVRLSWHSLLPFSRKFSVLYPVEKERSLNLLLQISYLDDKFYFFETFKMFLT